MLVGMKTLQPISDKASIGLSLLCAIHCLALPVAVTLLPSIAALGFADESFHTWLVIVVIPLSAFALTIGCRKHRQSAVLFIGVLGLLFLCMGPVLGHEVLSESQERALTLIGALLVAASHVKNFLLCREHENCECNQG